jgi:hypothetical protein
MKGAQTNRQAENRATAAAAVVVDNSAPMKGRPVEVPVAGLDQRVCVNAIVQRSQRAGRRDFEDRLARCPVEVAIAGLDERCAGISAVQAHTPRGGEIPRCARDDKLGKEGGRMAA